MLEEIKQEAREITEELIETAKMKRGQILVVGCSSSEIAHYRLGTHSSEEIGKAVFDAIYESANAHGIYLAAQCCEHLNRAVILEREAAERYGYEAVSVVPWLKGGGSFAMAAYYGLKEPSAVEHVKAHAGMDIGDVLIGMQLRDVAVPVRTARNSIGDAHVVCARTRPKYIGGERAHYTEDPEMRK
ncbi:MAG: TIGR01440 family protein [Fusicatenibacter sp.]|nr:TIGR01440 family protein [Fusicatenibacter sp.]